MSVPRLLAFALASSLLTFAGCDDSGSPGQLPVAYDDEVVAAEDTPITIEPLANDLAVDGRALHLHGAQVDVGTLTRTDTAIVYTPPPEWSGAATMTYTMSDGIYTVGATIHITVAAVDDPPHASDTTLVVPAGGKAQLPFAFSDIDSTNLGVRIDQPPSHGKVIGEPPIAFYQPDVGYQGEDALIYRVDDGTSSTTATVHITVTTDRAPIAHDANLFGTEDQALSVVLTGSDPDGGDLTYAIAQAPSHGTVDGAPPFVTYHPAPDFNGADTFTFTVSDGVLTGTGTVSVTVQAVNDAPVATAQTLTTAEDTAVAITLRGTDVDGDALTYQYALPAAGGTLTGSVPNLVYTPPANFNGTVTFSCFANDGQLGSAAATVTIIVTPVDDPPTATAKTVTTAEDTPVAITLAGADPEGDAITFAIATPPAHGTLVGAPPVLSYVPAANYNGGDVFTFTATANGLTSAPAVETVAITAVNDAPVANAAGVDVDEDGPTAIVLTASDIDSTSLTYQIVAPPQQGTLSGTPPNVVYAPAKGAHGADAFSFRASDGALSSADAVITLALVPVNVAPVAKDDVDETAVGTVAVVDALANDSDPDTGDHLTIVDVTGAAHGTATVTADAITYTPADGFTGTEVLTYTIADSGGLTATAKIRLGVGQFPIGVALERIAGCPSCTTTFRQTTLSKDGRYVAFTTPESFAAQDTNGFDDVYLYDRLSRTYELISAPAGGGAGDKGSFDPSVSDDGRYVAFTSSATNIVAGDTNGWHDVFVRDRVTQTTVRASVATDGTEGNATSWLPVISGDGRHVAFQSDAFTLVANDVNGTTDVFVRDLDTNVTERVSVSSAGVEGDLGGTGRVALSSDGNVVAFVSSSSNLVPADSNAIADAFVRDRAGHVTERVSISTTGTQADKNSFQPSLSADGRFVVFLSSATTLVPNDTNNLTDAFLHDRQTGNTTRLVTTVNGTYAGAKWASISGDGRDVALAFTVTGGTTTDQIYVRDQLAGTYKLASVTPGGAQANGTSMWPAISRNGRYLVFFSSAQNLSSASPWSYLVAPDPL